MPSERVLKQLFARSPNWCAFPGCAQELVDSEHRVIGEVAHIAARRQGGPRFDPTMSAGERDAVENLILLCPTHHTLIDQDEQAFSVETLLGIKKDASGSGVQPSDAQMMALVDFDVEIEVEEVVPARNFSNEWFIVKLDGFYLLNNLDRNVILQFELTGTLDTPSPFSLDHLGQAYRTAQKDFAWHRLLRHSHGSRLPG